MVRHCKLNISYLDKLKDASGHNEYRKIKGVTVKITSQRYKLFQENRVCVKCGVEGAFLAVEKFLDEIKKYHINMYGINEHGSEVLMTKDHIIPKSKGGKNHHDNYQTMCSKCNISKGNGDSMTLRKLFDDYVYNKTRKDIKKIDKLCVELDIEPNDFWYYFLKNKGDFSEVDFLTKMLDYFHYYLGNLLDMLYEKNNIEMEHFYFEMFDDGIFFCDGKDENYHSYREFLEKIVNADISLRKKLMNNKVFEYFMTETETKIFTDKEVRMLKLENIS